MTSPHDYSAFDTGPAAEGDLARIASLAREAEDAEIAVADAEEALRLARERLADVVERRLPEAMDAIGMENFSAGGLKVTVQDDVQVKQPPKNQRQAAYEWLRNNDQGGLVRLEVAVQFGPGETEQERAKSLLEDLTADGYAQAVAAEDVNTTSLKAFLRRALREGQSPPLELFGARAVRVAKIERR